MFPTDIVIVAGARTPMARYTGGFSEVSAIDLGAHASRAAIQRSGVDPEEIDHAIFWQCNADQCRRNLRRKARGTKSRAENGDAGGDCESAVWVRN